jgi:outer membrane autotransporter protein
LSYALNYYEHDRRILFGNIDRMAASDHWGHEFSAYLGGGYEFDILGLSLIPETSLQYIYLYEEGYTEKDAGAANLRFDSEHTHSLQSKVGLRLKKDFEISPEFLLTPEAHVGWAHEFLDDHHTVTAQFSQGTAGGSFDINGRDLGRDSAVAGLKLSLLWEDNLVLSLGYEADFGRNDYTTHGIKANVAFRFL